METKTIRRRWTSDFFESELRDVASVLGHFPSRSELDDMGRQDLASEIGRRGGFIQCSEVFGLPRVRSDSDKGWEGEAAAAQRLVELGFGVTLRETVKCPFDLLVDDVLRVDVKSARLYRCKRCAGWFYRIGKHPQADLILLWRVDEEDYFALPWYVCPRTNITLSRGGGKYSEFYNNDQLIRDMVEPRRIEQQHTFSQIPMRSF